MRTHLGLVFVILTACGGSSGHVDPGPDAARDDAAVTDPAPLRVFLTGAFVGTMYEPGGGLAGGDAKCAQAAAAAGVGGTWRAWLSTSTVNAVERIAGTGPWRLMDGTMVFASRTELASGPAHAIDRLADGETLGTDPLPVWTGTIRTGTVAGSTCAEWTNDRTELGRAGRSDAIGPAWTDNSTITCDTYAYLYCFEQPN
jgi:hypothetical protein